MTDHTDLVARLRDWEQDWSCISDERGVALREMMEAADALASQAARIVEPEQQQIDDAIVIGRLNSSEALQDLMRRNNELQRKLHAAHIAGLQEAAEIALALSRLPSTNEYADSFRIGAGQSARLIRSRIAKLQSQEPANG